MLLPQGLVRGLATQKLNLDGEEDEEDVADVTKLQPQSTPAVVAKVSGAETADDRNKGTGNGASGGGLARSSSFIKLNFMSTTDAEENESKTSMIWSILQNVAMMFRAKGRDSGARKRQLKPSMRAVVSMTAPFLLWGLVIIIINAMGNSEVSTLHV